MIESQSLLSDRDEVEPPPSLAVDVPYKEIHCHKKAVFKLTNIKRMQIVENSKCIPPLWVKMKMASRLHLTRKKKRSKISSRNEISRMVASVKEHWLTNRPNVSEAVTELIL